MPVDFSLLLKTYAKKFSAALNNRIRRKLGLDDQPYSPLAPSTYGGQFRGQGQRKKTGELKKRLANSRLNHTGRLRQNAFIGSSDDVSLTVEANPSSYDGKVTYKQIVEYNSRDSGRTNVNIKNPPLLFPQNEDQLRKLEVFQQFEKDLEQTIQLQMGDELAKEVPKDVQVRIG